MCVPAFSQDFSRAEVSGGYSFFRDNELTKNANGWYGSVGVNFDQWSGVVADFGGNYTTDDLGVKLRTHTFMGGPQFSIRNNSHVVPFIQFLVGGARGNATTFGGANHMDLAMQLGGGGDFWFHPTVGLRVGAHYRHIFQDFNPINGVRVQAGIVFALGKQ